jgi:hypothetical membrane protein
MEKIYIYNTCFGVGALLLFIALAYYYDIKAHSKSKRIATILLALGDIFLAIGLFGRYKAGYQIYPTGLIFLAVNIYLFYKMNKKQDNNT